MHGFLRLLNSQSPRIFADLADYFKALYRRERRGIREIAEKNEPRINTDFHGFFFILILDDL